MAGVVDRRFMAALQAAQDLVDQMVDGHTKWLISAWLQVWADAEKGINDILTGRHGVGGVGADSVRQRMILWQAAQDQAQAQLAALLREVSAEAVKVADELADVAIKSRLEIVEAQLPPGTVATNLIVQPNPGAVAQIVERATQQITVRHYYLEAEAAQAMKRALIWGTVQGRNPREMAARMVREVKGVFNGGLTRAMVIARTEMIDAYRNAQHEFDKANRDVLAGWQWQAELSDRTCRSCLAMHGTLHDIDEPGPLDHHQGRCDRVPVTKTWAELGFTTPQETRVWIDGDEAERWLERQPLEVQQRILTRRGYQAWQEGRWPRAEWTVRRENPEWRPSYHAAKPPKDGTPGASGRGTPSGPQPVGGGSTPRQIPGRDRLDVADLDTPTLSALTDDELETLAQRYMDAEDYEASERVYEFLDYRGGGAAPAPVYVTPYTAHRAFNAETFEWFEQAGDEAQALFADRLGNYRQEFYREQWAFVTGKTAKAVTYTERELRALFDEYVETMVARLEEATRGNIMRARLGERADPRLLFKANDKTARALASEETLRYFDEYGGRLNYTQFKAQFLGRGTDGTQFWA